MRHWAALVTVGVLLAVTASLAISPVASAAGSPHQSPAVPGAAASIVASAAPTSVTVGQSVELTLTVSDYNSSSCGAGTLNWQLVNGASFANPYSVSVSGNSTLISYFWDAEPPTGTWIFTGALSSQCALVTSNNVTIDVHAPSAGGGIWVPSWFYEALVLTYNAVKTALYQGIAHPISSVLEAVGAAFASLVAPWGSALSSLGIFGPIVLVVALLAMAMAVYAILAGVGLAKMVLGV